jgi:NAD(P)-dependent dehydrogenase (short-subunit alcohol dehydrogenase family)
MATPDDLACTVELVESAGGRIIARQGDTRDGARIQAVVDEGLAKFGAIDVAVANAGFTSVGYLWELDEKSWRDVIDVDLTGVWKTMKAVTPAMLRRRRGSIIVTGSTGGSVGIPRLGHYTAAKHGVIGLVKSVRNSRQCGESWKRQLADDQQCGRLGSLHRLGAGHGRTVRHGDAVQQRPTRAMGRDVRRLQRDALSRVRGVKICDRDPARGRRGKPAAGKGAAARAMNAESTSQGGWNMGRLSGKVALISGGARGQGRSHAVHLAREGADIVTFDVCSVNGRIIARRADVRFSTQIDAVVAEAIEVFGHIDIVVANAGIQSVAAAWTLREAEWEDVIDVNLSGAWRTVKAAVPAMLEQRRGGSIIFISSFAGLHALPNLVHYNAAKHGITGLSKAFALELAPHGIRVNSVHPATVRTPMVDNRYFIERVFGSSGRTLADVVPQMQHLHALPVPWMEVEDISRAVVYLGSDEARRITGIALPIDAGSQAPFKLPHQL